MSRRRRELTGLERELWRSVTRDVARIGDVRHGEPPKTDERPRGDVSARPKALEMSQAVAGPTGGLTRLAARLSGASADPSRGTSSKPVSKPVSKPAPSKRPRVLPPSYTPPQSHLPSRADGARHGTNGAKRDTNGAKRDLEMLEARTRRRLSRGQAEPDARIDLHGLVQSAAHEALRSFVLASRARGHRLVLVVTGKGEPVGTPAYLAANEGRGVIRRAVPRWLALPDMAPHVVALEPASRRHGGEGALYVRLRR